MAAEDIQGPAWRHLSGGPGAEPVHAHVWRVSKEPAMPSEWSLAVQFADLFSAFSSVYADLDVECILPSDDLFKTYNVSTWSHAKPRPLTTHDMHKSGRKAFLGRMGTDHSFDNSIPNAWMASTPGHPFFLLLVESVMKDVADGPERWSAEAITGPAKLFYTYAEYSEPQGKYIGEALDKHVAKNPAAKQFTPRKGLGHSVEVLPFQYIYPYSWQRDGEAFRSICWATQKTFNATKCKLLLATDHWPSYTITYWSHTWTGEGHDAGNVASLGE